MAPAGTNSLLDRHRRNQERAASDLTPAAWAPPYVHTPETKQPRVPEYSIRFARITGVTGDSPPYLYSATQVECLTAGSWTNTPAGMTWSGTLRNQAEHSGGGAASIPSGAVVAVICVNSEDNIWEILGRLEYRGTYG